MGVQRNVPAGWASIPNDSVYRLVCMLQFTVLQLGLKIKCSGHRSIVLIM